MNGPNYLNLFLKVRLSPWLPEHEKIIRAHLAMYEVEAPEKAAKLRAQYDQRLKEYEAVQDPQEFAATPVIEPVAETVVEAKPKKKKKKPVTVTETVVSPTL